MDIKSYLKIKGINAKEFAKQIKISISTLYGYIAGTCKPSYRVAITIERITGGLVTVNDLIISDYITIEEAASKYHQSESTVYEQIRRGLISSKKMLDEKGRMVTHVRKTELENFHERKWLRKENYQEDELTTTEICRMIGISHSRLYELLHEGSIKASRRKNRWVIKRHDVDEFIREREKEQEFDLED